MSVMYENQPSSPPAFPFFDFVLAQRVKLFCDCSLTSIFICRCAWQSVYIALLIVFSPHSKLQNGWMSLPRARL